MNTIERGAADTLQSFEEIAMSIQGQNQSETREGFYLVWCPSGVTPPKFRHERLNDAIKEAERLAREKPGSEFYVLEANTMRVVNDMTIVNFDSIPF